MITIIFKYYDPITELTLFFLGFFSKYKNIYLINILGNYFNKGPFLMDWELAAASKCHPK